ncbi:MAG: DUF721 domain-containing protein [Saprospiraceae bacterium]|nr:DUF721 domain-containing protein [Saprospiraceae bacterium]
MSNFLGSNEKSFRELMKEYIKLPGIRQQYIKVVLKMTWEENMGPLITKYTRRLTLSKGVLTIKVDSAPLRQELSFNKIKIIEMYQKAFGEDLVREIVIS